MRGETVSYNYDVENTSMTRIQWYINGVRITYLDNLRTWNDISNVNDPLFTEAFSFTLADLEPGQTVEEKARINNESILKVGDTVYCQVSVSDGITLGSFVQSNNVLVKEAVPSICNLNSKAI